MKIAITGGRDHHVTPEELSTFWRLFTSNGGTELHHGNAMGVDLTIALSSIARGIPTIPHHADWKAQPKLAGFIRNVKMLSCVDMLIAFPGGRGTRNCVQRAKLMKIKTLHVAKELAG